MSNLQFTILHLRLKLPFSIRSDSNLTLHCNCSRFTQFHLRNKYFPYNHEHSKIPSLHCCNATKFNSYYTITRVSLPYYSVFHKGNSEFKNGHGFCSCHKSLSDVFCACAMYKSMQKRSADFSRVHGRSVGRVFAKRSYLSVFGGILRL